MEFSGLDLDEAYPMQFAMIITDYDLTRLMPPDHDFNCTIALPEGVPISNWVKKHLPQLVEDCRKPSAVGIETLNRQIGEELDQLFGKLSSKQSERPVLAGNSMHHDWYLARKFLPALTSRVHYRHLDVSSIKQFWNLTLLKDVYDKNDAEVVRRFCPVQFNNSLDRHDAHYDVLASLSECHYYRHMITAAPEADV